MLTKKQKEEEINYQIELIKNDKQDGNKNKGYLSLDERDKITILCCQNYSI